MKRMKLMKRYYSPHKRLFAVGVVSLTASTCASVMFPQMLGEFVDSFTAQSSTSPTGTTATTNLQERAKLTVYQSTGVITGVFTVVGLTMYWRTSVMQKLAQRVAKQMRHDLYWNLLKKKPISYYDREVSGASLASRLTNDVEVISDFISRNSMTGMRALGEGIGGLSFLYIISSHMTSLVFFQTWIPMMLVIGFSYSRHVKNLNSQYLNLVNKQSKFISERVANMKSMIHTFSKQRSTIAEYEKEYQQPLYSTGYKLAVANGIFDGIVYTGTHLSVLAMIIMGTMSVLNGSAFTIGDLSALFLYSVYVVQSFGTLSGVYSKYLKYCSAYDRVAEMLTDTNDCELIEGGSRMKLESGTIEFKNVSFTYEQKQIPTLVNFDLLIPSGQQVVVLGESGIGKSTLASLLARFYSLKSGSGTILLGGLDIVTIDPVYLRQQCIANVPQDAIVFHASVIENITFSSPEAEIDMDLLMKFSKLTGVHNFVSERFPSGYNTILGDRGSVLSGGQKQRLNLCRTLYHYHQTNCKVYIFDESTSALDIDSEIALIRAIQEYCKGVGATSLFITHRVTDEIVALSDQVIVLKEGKAWCQ